MGVIYRDCIQCGSEFYIKEKDQDFFLNKCRCGHSRRDHDPQCHNCACDEFSPLEFPKRCWRCRQKNKKDAARAQADQRQAERRARDNGNRQPRRAPQQGVVEVFVEDRRAPARVNRQGRGSNR
jgi:hypothetical protein